jgi:hypothetical protein
MSTTPLDKTANQKGMEMDIVERLSGYNLRHLMGQYLSG